MICIVLCSFMFSTMFVVVLSGWNYCFCTYQFMCHVWWKVQKSGCRTEKNIYRKSLNVTEKSDIDCYMPTPYGCARCSTKKMSRLSITCAECHVAYYHVFSHFTVIKIPSWNKDEASKLSYFNEYNILKCNIVWEIKIKPCLVFMNW